MEAPLHVAPPWKPGITMVPLVLGGVNAGPERYFTNWRNADSCASGEMSVRSDSPRNCRLKGGGFTGKGWVEAVCSPGTSDDGTGRFSMGKRGSPVSRSKRKT